MQTLDTNIAATYKVFFMHIEFLFKHEFIFEKNFVLCVSLLFFESYPSLIFCVLFAFSGGFDFKKEFFSVGERVGFGKVALIGFFLSFDVCL